MQCFQIRCVPHLLWLRGVATVLTLLSVCAAHAASYSTSYDRLYVFGDSYSDTGAGYVYGNGPTAVAYLAERMGISLAVPSPVTGSIPARPDSQSLNFAVSAAATGANPGKVVKTKFYFGLGMKNQVDDFNQRVRNDAIRFNPDTTLFFFAGGLNDRNIPGEETVANIEAEIASLYALGARHFAVALLPTKIPDFSAVGERLNPWLARIPDDMKQLLPGIDIRLSRWGPFFDAVIQNPAIYGINDTTSTCSEGAVVNPGAAPCASPETHFYYYKAHPSTAVNRLVGDMLFNELQMSEKMQAVQRSSRPRQP